MARSNREFPTAGGIGYGSYTESVPPGLGIDADDPTKYATEMRLVAQTALQSHLRQGQSRRHHQFFGTPDTPLRDVGTRGLSEGHPKGPEEVTLAELNNAGEVVGANSRVQVIQDMRLNAFGLPRRETSSRARMLRRRAPLGCQIDSQ
jgi:hypothetical protein